MTERGETRTVLCGPHRPRIDVHVGIDLDSGDLEACGLEEEARR